MRILCGILFLVGCPFAAIAWISLVSPLGIFQPQYQYQLDDILISLSASVLAATGYLIWIGWGAYAVGIPLSRVSTARLWLISLINHTGWLILFPFLRRSSLIELATNAGPLFFWLVINLTIAVCTLLIYFTSENCDEFESF